jgi:hypothetical protein
MTDGPQDFDGGVVGRTVVEGLTQNAALAAQSKVRWTLVDARDFSEGPSQVGHVVVEQQTWTAITSTFFPLTHSTPRADISLSPTVNPGSSDRLQASYTSPNASYDGSDAITVFGNEARNENA